MARAKKHPALVPGGPWHQLASGAPFALEGPPTPLTIEDVAASLSKICRFAGACTRFVSVAQHSVLVAAIVRYNLNGSPADVIGALLHDAAEMVLGDIPRPAKKRLQGIKELEADILARTIIGLDVSAIWKLVDHSKIQKADEIALATERKHFMAKAGAPWGKLPPPTPMIGYGMTAASLSPTDARALYVDWWDNWMQHSTGGRRSRIAA